MKKVIFLSAIALAAAVSCSKSEVVDTKFESETIGFDTYIGRDAQTKATIADAASLQVAKGGGIGIYGFYTATTDWKATTAAKLLSNENLYYADNAWKYDAVKYWTNETDKYTFFAYAPYGNENIVAPTGEVADPAITYTVVNDLKQQTDLLYSNNAENVTKTSCTKDGTTAVPFQFKHALSRLSVKAKAVMYDLSGAVVNTPAANQKYDNIFTITDITLTGKFNTTGTLTLSSGLWTPVKPTATTTYDLVDVASKELNAEFHDFSASANYLMLIPTDFSAEGNAANLNVTYTITYAGATSAPITKPLTIATKFEPGKAYSINLILQRDKNNAITFTVESIEGWGSETGNDVTVS